MSYQPTLLIIAAGMGSRYGGLKQIDPIGLGVQKLKVRKLFENI